MSATIMSASTSAEMASEHVALTIDAVQSGALLHSTELSAGDAFSELGDLILDGLSRPADS